MVTVDGIAETTVAVPSPSTLAQLHRPPPLHWWKPAPPLLVSPGSWGGDIACEQPYSTSFGGTASLPLEIAEDKVFLLLLT